MRWVFRSRHLDLTHDVRVMGIVNVTPDSFSDGGRYDATEAALAHALAMVEAGADVLDVGGESTRPGSEPVSAELERARVVPVIQAIRARCDIPISIDTCKAAVAAAALDAGAEIVNDVTALGDPDMAGVVARAGAGLVLMHMRGEPRTMQRGDLSSPDIAREVARSLAARVARAQAAGVPDAAIVLDPGIGFGKTYEQNVELLARLEVLGGMGSPVLVGVSRKAFLGALTGRPVEERAFATAAACACAVMAGAHVLRVHDVGPMRDVARVAGAIRALRRG